MKQIFKGLLTLVLLGSFVLSYSCCGPSGCSALGACKGCATLNLNQCCYSYNKTFVGPCDGYPFLLPRSQSVNAARDIVGIQQFINRYDMDINYGVFSATVEYAQSFKPERLSNYFFGCNLINCNNLLIQGSGIENRDPRAWLADYFGLPRDFESTITFCPRIKNVMVDLNWHFGLDNWREGMYFKIHAPITWTKTALRMCECISKEGTETAGYFPAGYMALAQVETSALAKSFMQAIGGTHTWGDMKEPLKFGIMTNCSQTKIRFSDIQMALGYNFILKQDGHVGINLRLYAPTGNKPCAIYLFEPVVGNGKHWELGGGLSASYICWRSEEHEDRFAGLWLDANITHLFKSCQCRSFDLFCKPNSRYMLLEEMTANETGNDHQINGEISSDPIEVVPATYRYANNLIPAINWSTFNVDVKIALQADIALKLAWVRENWSFDLGYNLWARSGEKYCFDCCGGGCCCDDGGCACCVTSACGLYAVKGDSYIYGFRSINPPEGTAITATQCAADIHAGKNYPDNPDNSDYASVNPRIDNPLPAWCGATIACSPLFDTSGRKVNTSIQPVLVSQSCLNLGKGPKAITHKLFGHISYSWKNREDDLIPFIGVGGEVEFGARTKNSCDPCCGPCGAAFGPCGLRCGDSCSSCCPCTRCDACSDPCDYSCKKYAGISQWGVWIKGGLAFDCFCK